MVNGVLPYQEIWELIETGGIILEEGAIPLFSDVDSQVNSQVGGASFEPTLGEKVYHMSSSNLPFNEKGLSEILESENLENFELTNKESKILHKGKVYVIPLNEKLNLIEGIIGESTGRSSVGRTNTILKLLTEDYQRYNSIPSGYRGKLYLEVYPQSFPIKVRKGISLNQIKFAYKSFENIDELSLKLLHEKKPILYDKNGDALSLDGRIKDDGVVMSLRLKGGDTLVYKARKNVSRAIDLSRDFKDKKNRYEIDEFWVKETVRDGKVILSPDEFYIMITRERIAVPPGYVTKMKVFDPDFADIKTQEADLFNPGHGHLIDGFCPVAEVKVYGPERTFRHGDSLCRIYFQKLRETPTCKLYDEKDEAYIKQVEVCVGKMFI